MHIKKKQLSGGARLKMSGKAPVSLGLKPEEKELLTVASIMERRPLTQYILFHALAAAQKLTTSEPHLTSKLIQKLHEEKSSRKS